ncbi:hypothetical protein CAPTEDRAFT_225282 [Capitella teleta]|uniref:DIS3-like exonuclease 2 n=1 Tax=Capitella teleta TaxID=283909 RepID=R7TX22_CAPTE|nr:hypothetical protein CAPTEDRAFT_225282 [Capitella teleta]|eukprot:ELT98463.1 hypothetical protein CAPTEDRAFT_225282 [Capitella teleta]
MSSSNAAELPAQIEQLTLNAKGASAPPVDAAAADTKKKRRTPRKKSQQSKGNGVPTPEASQRQDASNESRPQSRTKQRSSDQRYVSQSGEGKHTEQQPDDRKQSAKGKRGGKGKQQYNSPNAQGDDRLVITSGTSLLNLSAIVTDLIANPLRRGNQEPIIRIVQTMPENFEDYWSKELIQQGLKRGTLIEGSMRINPKNYEQAYVPHPDGHSDVFICGVQHRNRAFNTDVVVVEVFPVAAWKVMIDELMPASGAAESAKSPAKQVKNKSCNYVSVEDIAASDLYPEDLKQEVRQLLASDSHPAQLATLNSVLRTGKVVYISLMKHSRASAGFLKPFQDKNPSVALFCPTDHRIPRIKIPIESCPADFRQRPDIYAKTLFIASITNWEPRSTYAMGQLQRSLGEAGMIEPETEAMLTQYSVDETEFSADVINCLPQNLPWSIPVEEYSNRKDLRNECVFTIDPATARDLDDALHCCHLGDGIYEIGVHIADVSYFVSEGTALDQVASDRATSVYLVQKLSKVVPMLPRLLCEKLCSLNPDEDRLTFSVIWRITEEGEILDQWFGRSIIRSCVKLSYDHAQGFIENPEQNWEAEQLPPVSEGFCVEQIKERVLNLNKVAVNLRKQRFDAGALRLDKVKLQFSLDKESGLPNGFSVYQQKDSNRLVEEFMLLANMSVAHKIHENFPDQSVLRRHPPPQLRMLDELSSICKSLGIPIDTTSSLTMQQSIAAQAENSEQEAKSRMLVLTSMCARPMQLALYFCSGTVEDEDLYQHYALNVPFYTHFTSPIRRYPDIMVHRQLAASLGYSAPSATDKRTFQVQCNHCNDKRTAAKMVSELSADLFFSVFVKECGPFEHKAMVQAVLDRSFDVLILAVGVVKRVYLDKLPLKSFNFRKVNLRPELTLAWQQTEIQDEVVRTITIFSEVSCRLETVPDDPLRWQAVLLHPSIVI